ncbi:MAG TPA: GntR family transcriptional regulator [Firmicutes bacterium]|nr:hypothetical protein [Bacillota bacterium]MDK2928152.1 hypothetical protein [Bacillota bacterium]HHV57353.1 GntR family transcriptional regulator [Bacillota bacterium]
MQGRIFFHSLREQLFQALKEAILTNKYRPGEELPIDKLAAEFGVSTTPVREALVRLEGIGLVRLIPNRGAQVTSITPADVRHIWEVRRLLEPYAARTAAERCSVEELDALEDKLQRVLARPEEFDLYTESDLELHELLVKHLTNGVLMEILDRVKLSSLRMRYFSEENIPTLRREVIQQATREHLAIVAALRAHDAARTENMVYQHLVNGEKRTLLGLEGRLLEA